MALKHAWWVLVLRGLIAILFGAIAFAWPELTVGILVLLFGIYALVDGVISVFSSVLGRDQQRNWWLALLIGLIGIAVGIAVFVWPRLTAVLLLYFIAIRALIVGVYDIIMAIVQRKEIVGGWLLLLGGVVQVLFGAFVMIRPGTGALAIIWLIALYAVVVGIVQLILGFTQWRMAREA